jgi:hypothetical protein
MTHYNVRPLGGNDVFFDGWNESYVVQSAMWNNSETQFFGITTGRVRSDCEMVASMFAARPGNILYGSVVDAAGLRHDHLLWTTWWRGDVALRDTLLRRGALMSEVA